MRFAIENGVRVVEVYFALFVGFVVFSTHSVRFGEEGKGVGDGGADAEFGDDFGVVLDG